MNKRRDKVVWNVKDILSSTRVAAMTLEVEGAYRRSLDLFYLNGYLPSNEAELAKWIGKGCSLEIASEVKRMYLGVKNYPLILTHDYLAKLLDGQDVEMMLNNEGSNEKRKKFVDYCNTLKNDEFLIEYAFQKYGLVTREYSELVDDFIKLKVVTEHYLSYSTRGDVRKNLVNYMPYSNITKLKLGQNERQLNPHSNPKSVTSKLKQWQF